MALFEQIVLEDTVEINTTPEKIWEFWAKMDKHYKAWHPEDHILFQWTKENQWKTVQKYMLKKLWVENYSN